MRTLKEFGLVWKLKYNIFYMTEEKMLNFLIFQARVIFVERSVVHVSSQAPLVNFHGN